MNKQNNMHFIVGMPRAGTTWMMQTLSRHPEIVAFGETGFFGKNDIEKEMYEVEDLVKFHKKLIYLGRSIAKDLCIKDGGLAANTQQTLASLIDKGNPIGKKELLLAMASGIMKSEGKTIAIEKTPHHINHLGEIRRYFPESKILILSRSAKEFMLSYKHQADRKEEIVKKNLKSLYHPLGCALVYRKAKSSILSGMKRPNTLYVEHDEIKYKPKELMNRVYTFLEVEEAPFVTHKVNSSFPKNEEKKLSLDDLLWLSIFGHIQSMDITPKQKMMLPFVLLVSLLKLPIWAFSVFGVFRRTIPKGKLFPYLKNYLFKTK